MVMGCLLIVAGVLGGGWFIYWYLIGRHNRPVTKSFVLGRSELSSQVDQVLQQLPGNGKSFEADLQTNPSRHPYDEDVDDEILKQTAIAEARRAESRRRPEQ